MNILFNYISKRISFFLAVFLFLAVSSQNLFASKRVDNLFALVENKNVPASTIKKELAKSSTLYKATRGAEKETLLMVALKNDRGLDVVTVILDAGVDPEIKSKQKKTALMYACQYSTDVNVVEKVLTTLAWFDLSKKKRVLAKDKSKQTSFDYADLNENEVEREKIINLLLKYAERPKKEIEKPASEPSDEIEIEEKVPETVEPIEEPPIVETPIEEPAKEEIPIIPIVAPVAEPIAEPEAEESEIEEEPKEEIPAAEPEEDFAPIPDVNERDAFGRTKLMIAAGEGNLEQVKALLKAGAIVDVCDNEGCTALMYGTRYQKNPDILKVLLDNNANFRTTSESGMSALMYAASENPELEFIKLLLGNRLASETDLQAAFIKAVVAEDSESILEVFVNHGISTNIEYEGKTPLMHAAQKNKSTSTIKWLLRNGASKTIRTIDGKNAADFASENTALPHDKVYRALFNF